MRNRGRSEDTSHGVVFKGMLWKLNTGGDANNPAHWLKRDMWISENRSLCYYSLKENKRLVLLDGNLMVGSTTEMFTGGAMASSYQFRVHVMPDHDDHADGQREVHTFACESERERNSWIKAMEQGKDEMLGKMRLGGSVMLDLQKFRLAVKNRRLKVGDARDKCGDFEPEFKARLWKLKANGNRMTADHWFERDMWLSKNGSLVYWSKKEERELIYYIRTDVCRSSVMRIASDVCVRPWAFLVRLSASNGIEFAPGEFAAENEEMRDQWFRAFERMGAVAVSEVADRALLRAICGDDSM